MRYAHESLAGVAGVVLGVVAGAGATTLLIEEPAVPSEPSVERPAPSGQMPEHPDRLVQWLKEHRR